MGPLVSRFLDANATRLSGKGIPMLNAVLFLCAVAIAVSFATLTPSLGDDEHPLDDTDTSEPITGDPVMPLPGSETPMKDPFAPYDTGGGDWTFEHLTAAEKVVAARGLNED